MELNKVLSSEENCKELSSDPIFQIFQKYLVEEVKRHENESNQKFTLVLARILQINQIENSVLKLTDECIRNIAEYLFEQTNQEQYAKLLPNNEAAQSFLNQKHKDRKEQSEKAVLASNLGVKIGSNGELDFSKSIFNSPQEEELYLAAKNVLKNVLLLPNIALSTIINSKITELLDGRETSFFYASTIDLCIVDQETYKPTFYIELDSSWHDKPRQVEKDKLKDKIFEFAGFNLHRIRKKNNRPMKEVFELYLKKYYAS